MQNTGNGPSATVQLVLKINKWQERKIMQNKLPIQKQKMPKVKHKHKKQTTDRLERLHNTRNYSTATKLKRKHN